MAIKTDAELKQYFQTGDIPTQQQFWNLIDSKLNVADSPAFQIEIGVTPITSGAENSILFQNSGVVQQNSVFVFDSVNSRIGMDEASPLTRMHFRSTVGNTDASPLTLSFQRKIDTYNSNTTWFSHRALNGYGQRVGAISIAQQATGQGTRFSVLVTNDSTTTQATEGLRLSQEKRLSIGDTMNNGAVVDVQSAGNLSTDLGIRVRNYANTFDHFKIGGDGSMKTINNATTNHLFHIDESFTGTIVQTVEMRNGNTSSNDQTLKFTNYRWNYSDPLLTSTSVISSKTYATSINNKLIISNENAYPDSSISFNVSTSPSAIAFEALRVTALRNVMIGGTNTNAGTNGEGVFVQYTGVSPSSSPVDSFQMYSADIVAGNSAPHFRTENGAIVKIYQETTAVASATVVSGSGGTVKHDDTFDGYTLEKVVKALRNLGILA